MVIGCVVFTLPHFLNPEVHSASSHLFQSGQYGVLRAVQSPNLRNINDRLNNGSSSSEDSKQHHGISYNSTRDNDTVFHLEHRTLDTSSISQHSAFRQGGRNSICHSANPQSSRFISATSNSRLNNVDLHEMGQAAGVGGTIRILLTFNGIRL
jgi:hypothetical protein